MKGDEERGKRGQRRAGEERERQAIISHISE